MKLYIIRHGQTDLNKKMGLQGRSNNQLNENGIRQAKEAAEFLKGKGVVIDKVYTSPLDRAVDTAKLVAGEEVEHIIDERLLEMDYGPYEGLDMRNPPPEIMTFFSDFVHNKAPQGMEDLDHVVLRSGELIESLKDMGEKNILLSTHAIAMKGILEYLTPDSHGSYWNKFIANCDIYISQYENGRFTVPVRLD